MDVLERLYNNELNLDNANTLYHKAKKLDSNIKLNDVKEFLTNQSTYQQNYKNNKKKNYLPIYSNDHYSFQLDLTFLPKYKQQNKGYTVIFTAININSKYVYAYAMKSKSAIEINEILNKFLHNALMINNLTFDKGLEFTNKLFDKFCENNYIKTYPVKADSHKLGIINRF